MASMYNMNNDIKDPSTQVVSELWAQSTIDTWWVSQDGRIFANMNNYSFLYHPIYAMLILE